MSKEPTDVTISPIEDDDLADRLTARAPVRVTRTIVVLASLFLIVAGFVGGIVVEQNWGTTSPGNTGGANLPGSLPNFGNAGPSNASRGTTGKVTLVDGTTVYVTTDAGDVVTIKTNASPTVRSQTAGALKDLKVGATVTVTGATASDGSVTATQITSTP
jgi:hypothetical protein